ncbi:MAG: MFS transporter [Gammaproteobacteria bacterium]|nr:MFS transporter [Gammaproteobacteria bacterium]
MQAFRLLKTNSQFRLLFMASFTSFLGSSMTLVVMPYQVYQLTKSTVIVGLLSLCILLPLLFTALIGGVFADHFPKRKILLFSDLSMSMGVLTLAINSHLEHPHLFVIFGSAFFISAMNGFHRPAFAGIVQQILRKDEIKNASIISSFRLNFGTIIGPSLSGLLMSSLGITYTFTLDFCTFLFSVSCIYRLVEQQKPNIQKRPPIFKSLQEGVQYAISHQTLLGSYLIDFFAMFVSMPSALFPAMAEQLGGVKTLGFLHAAPGVGALLITLLSGWTQRIKSDGKAITIAAGVWGLGIMGAGLSHSLILTLGFLCIAGMGDSINGIFRHNLWNQTIPTHIRGRLSGIEMLSYICGPKLGDFRAGLCASVIGIPATLISGGICCVIAVSLLGYHLKDFWNYQEKPQI